jgi:DNA-binding transcriptional LysR family regulator
VRTGAANEKWLGIECCGFHVAWTKDACPDPDHSLFCDDTLLTLAALKAGAGLAYLPCFMGDSEPSLMRYRAPEEQHELGLWLVYHRDLRRVKRVRLFRKHIVREVANVMPRLDGSRPA